MLESIFANWSLELGAPVPPLEGKGVTPRRVQVPAGTVADRHSHAHEQFLLVTAGRGALRCQAGEIGLAPGVVIHLAAGAWHSAVFETSTVLVEVNLAVVRVSLAAIRLCEGSREADSSPDLRPSVTIIQR